jgi:hypothetical protein
LFRRAKEATARPGVGVRIVFIDVTPRLRYWELRRFGSLENPSSIDVGLTIGIGEACRLANQAAGSDIVTDVVRYAQVLLG